MAVPELLPVTTPDEDTEATLVLFDVHVSSFVASEGVIVGVKVIDSPTTTDLYSGRDMPVGALGCSTIM